MLTVQVRNPLAESRPATTVALDLRHLHLTATPERLRVRDAVSGKLLVSQLVDNDGDHVWDELLCQVTLGPQERRRLAIELAPAGQVAQPAPAVAYSRFVPERIDDYAWENDRVAFRTYGPKAQQLTEAGSKDGTLTSGMDCWLKRVPYSIIDKWYAGYAKDPTFYHHDRGEGYDPYHVGDSRGCGGLGVWNDRDSTLAVSKNFIRYQTLATGPLRTVFELTYAPWSAAGQQLTQRTRITLDAGQQLSRYDVFVAVDHGALPPLTVGITLHEQKGTVAGRPAAGWFRHWEPIDDSELGTGLVMAPGQVQNWWTYRTTRKEQSHLFVRLKPAAHLTYYAGYGWTKAGRFHNVGDWESYLAAEARRLAAPLEVTVLRPAPAGKHS
ncbi:hypothetical protein AXW84_20305 [Hymenobacter sp. PAMC 26628]|nr:hypothetical protein AXW84_20305 [Hymenobacter sp. PAMC 26628]